MKKVLSAFFIFAVACAACNRTSTNSNGGSQPSPSPASSVSPSLTSSPSPSQTFDGKLIEVSVSGGQVTVAEQRSIVATRTKVRIVVVADVEDEVHLHGYDLKANVSPTIPAVIEFSADIPGVFEVELESASKLLFELQVE